MPDYRDVLAQPRRRHEVPVVAAEAELVVETADGRFCGAVVATGSAVDAGEKRDTVTLEDRLGRRRVFPMLPASFLLDGKLVTLARPAAATPAVAGPIRTASGSISVPGARARTARAARIWVEGRNDAELVERIWGDDLRVEGIVVEPIDGIDRLAERLALFGPGPGRRVGVLVDHLVAGSKESRLAATVNSEHVLITGHPFVDIWAAVKPARVGLRAWPDIPRGIDWKTGICAAVGEPDVRDMWRRVLAAVDGYADVEVPLLRSMEELIDFVTA